MAVQWSGWMKYLWGSIWNPERGQQSSGPSRISNSTGTPVTDDRAMQIGAVFRCIRLIAETCASLPIQGYKRLPNGDAELLPDDHWLQYILKYPNDNMTGDEWAESMYGQMAGWGNAYSDVVPNSLGRAVELWPLKVDRMEVTRLKDRSLEYKYPDVYGMPQVKAKGRVLHLRAFSLDGIMGQSALGAARETLGLAVGAESFAGSFYANGGRPSGIMTSDKLLTDAQRAQIRKEYGGVSGGGEDGKRFWVLEGSLKYSAITVNPQDLQMLETRTFSVEDIARFFGVPLFLLMSQTKDTSWGSGIEQQNLGFLTYTLRPYLSRMRCTLNRGIIPERERKNIFIDIDESPLLQLDSAAQKELWTSLASNAVLTRNEIRRKMKLPRSAEPNADKLTCQTALTTIDKLGETPRPAPGLPGAAPVKQPAEEAA